MVKPATVSGWRRKRGLGRPRISVEVRKLIVEMAELAKNLLLEQTAIEVIEQERVQNELVFELIETATGFGRPRQRSTIGEVRTLS